MSSSEANLQLVTDAALAHLELGALLDALLERIQQILTVDTVAVLLLEDDGQHLQARAARGLEEEVERGFRLPLAAGFAGRVAAERTPVTIEELKEGDAVNPLLYEKKIRSLLGVPLVVEGRLLGVLHVGSLTVRRFTEDDVNLLQVVGDRVALAIDHARLYEAERSARATAEGAIARVEQLQAISDAALAQLDLDDLLRVLLERTTAIFGVDTAAVLLADVDGDWLVARAAKGLEEEVERGFRLPIGAGFAGRIAAERQPVILDEVLPGTVVNPLMFEAGVKSLMGVPLIVERRLVGVLHVGTLTPRKFTSDDADLLQRVADRVGIAIEHDRLFEQFKLTEVLQRTLLPTVLPEVPGVTVSARYLPAAAETTVGGDWYDVISLRDGAVGVAIGDVVGHGLGAATLMGGLRTALHAYAFEGHGPAELARRLARFAESWGPASMATYAFALYHPQSATVRIVNGSHPQPLLVRPDGSAEFIEAPIMPPLGVAGAVIAEEAVIALEPGETLLFYTDGLVERRGMRLATRQDELLAAAAAAPFAPDLLCEALIGQMIGDEPPADDVAVLALQRAAGAEQTLSLTVATRAEELASIRRLLRGWLADAGADEKAVAAVLLASGEACSNAMEHAYGPGDQTFDLTAEREDDSVVLTVVDRGNWRKPRGVNRGRGLGLIETFMDEVEVTPGSDGTVVRMKRRLAG